jgi:uncharacterized protein (TIGR00251 family)
MKINVRVSPGAKKEKIEESDGGLKVYMNVPAIEGRANKKLIEILAEYYGIKKYNIKIVLGEKKRDKVIEIETQN